MCASHGTIAFGFSNGVLVTYDCTKAYVNYAHKVSRRIVDKYQSITKNQSAISGLKMAYLPDPVMFLLSDGQLSYFSFPKILPIEQLLTEKQIVDFDIYKLQSTFLATVHASNELKVFMLVKEEF